MHDHQLDATHCLFLGFADLEHSIVEAARNNDDRLDDLLQQACETMDEDRCNRLLDRVHQIMSEALREVRGWKEASYEDWRKNTFPGESIP